MVEEEIRRQLAQRARSRRTRTSAFSRELPGEWTPTAITRPGGSEPYTDDSAWEAVADALEGGCEIEVISLEKPPGKKGYVLLLESAVGVPIYVKLQLTAEGVHGRSFHYSKAARHQVSKDNDNERNSRQASAG